MSIVKGPIKPFNSTTRGEHADLVPLFFGRNLPLSGYLAGKERGGCFVRSLEDKWAETFKVKHAIACNSATSGLLAAAFIVGLRRGDTFLVPAMTMSATIAAPTFTGATPMFGDVDAHYFALSPITGMDRVKAVFLTHLFGAAIDESWWAGWGRQNNIKIIVDAAQSPFAIEPKSDRYAGTIADIGVYSLNVHKPLQCGEGGIIVTNDDDMAAALRAFINHGEHLGFGTGLNLRMPELCAAVALAQLRRAPEIIGGRIKQAEAVLAAIGDIPGIRPPDLRRGDGAVHVYYTIPFVITQRRAEFCARLRAEGIPIVEGYSLPYILPAFSLCMEKPCLVADDLHRRRLFYIENCAWDFTEDQIKQIGEAFRKVAKDMELEQ